MIPIIFTILFALYLLVRLILARKIMSYILDGMDKELMPHDKNGKRTLLYDFCDKMGFSCKKIFITKMNKTAFVTKIKGEYVIVIGRYTYDNYDRNSIASILAHEIGHVKNKDFEYDRIRMILYFVCSTLFVFIMDYYGFGLVSAIGAVIMMYLMNLHVGRTQEYDADMWAAVHHSAKQRCSILGRIKTNYKKGLGDNFNVFRKHPPPTKRYDKLLPLLINENKKLKRK